MLLLIQRAPSDSARAALGTDELPLLVRLQYMNKCHALNTAAAMALRRYAALHGVEWRVSTADGRDEPVSSLGWGWGEAPGAVQVAVAQARTERIRFQAHAHQCVAVYLQDGEQWTLDLAAAQFGDTTVRTHS